MSKATQFLKGARLGMPIALGYIPVSFSFGMLAVQNGIPAWAAIVISMTNLTSAGQFAGMNIISAAGGMWEMAITTFVINLRYMLMSLSLSQKIGKMSLAKRLITAFGITDEVFAVASTTPIAITFPFMLGTDCNTVHWLDTRHSARCFYKQSAADITCGRNGNNIIRNVYRNNYPCVKER